MAKNDKLFGACLWRLALLHVCCQLQVATATATETEIATATATCTNKILVKFNQKLCRSNGKNFPLSFLNESLLLFLHDKIR